MSVQIVDNLKVVELKRDLKDSILILKSQFKDITNILIELEEELGSASPEINALGHFKEDGLAQIFWTLEEGLEKLSSITDEVCKRI